MLTNARTTTLHVFPTHGSWEPSEDVMIVTTVGDLPISESYNYVTYHYGEHLVSRDTVFTVIQDPIFRSRYDDIVVYAEPYTTLWCTLCEDDRYPLTRQNGQETVSICDACGCLLDAPF